MVSRFAAVPVAVALAACAARGPSLQVTADLGKAAALVHDGCHTCLQDALVIYDRLAASPKPPPPAVQGAFETALLLSIREKELGLPWEASMARARELAPRVRPSAPPALAPAALLAAAGLGVGETSGMDPDQRAGLWGRARPALGPDNPVRRALDRAIGGAPLEGAPYARLAAYLALAIDCEHIGLRDAARPEDALARFPQPLMRFRAGLCARGIEAVGVAMEPLRASDPRWADTLLFEARRELVGSPRRGIDLYAAEALLAQAHAAFPASWAITLAWANANLALAEFDKALAGFDHVLAAAPAHRDAMLGRVTALSYALRHDEAVATATRMIALGTWHMGDAYYWRAWNRYNLKTIEPAWADVEEALKLLSNTGAYTLAGLIAYSRQQLPTAIERFDRAFAIDGSNCDAVWMASLIHVEQQAWPLATPKFSRSMSCYVSAAAGARSDLATLEASDRPEVQKTRTRARLQKTIEVSDERAAQSAFNAAQGHLRQGHKGQALTHVDVAAAYAPLGEKAAALKAAIEKMPN